MAYARTLLGRNFIEYASYVIKERAIPHIDDGLKPVQRRLMHTLFQIDDGRFHKVANVVGHTMQYHPHGDASIYQALVNLANHDLFIDRQGNFGNIYTGDEASAARYIECRARPFAKEVLYNPPLTTYEDSYDGRRKEPVVLPAKIPVVLIQGTEGIAVGMSTRILPHNFVEVLQAVAEAIDGNETSLYPDFPTGGLMDVTDYRDGRGKVVVRARLDTSDPKRIVIREIPFGTTTEGLIASVENAARRGKIKIASINDYTTDKVEIEIKLARGVYSEETVAALFAFTDCETAISVNPLLIRDNRPEVIPVAEIIAHHAKRLVEILTAELKHERGELEDRLHARTLERIFIEERLYKGIEEMRTAESVTKAVHDGFKPFAKEILRPVTDDDVERLLKIPIRRISRYDIERAKKEMEEIRARLKEIEHHLKHINEYAKGIIASLIEREGPRHERLTEITGFSRVEVREVAARDRKLRYDRAGQYLGTELDGGEELFSVSDYDRVLAVSGDGQYRVLPIPEKRFVEGGLLYAMIADKDEMASVTFTLVYRETESGIGYIKRFHIEKYILERAYRYVPEGAEILLLTTKENIGLRVSYKPTPRTRITEERFLFESFRVKGVQAGGVRLSPRQVTSVRMISRAKASEEKER
jgi:topoisomerase IV subunit A